MEETIGGWGTHLQACLYLIFCCMQEVVCQTTVKVTSDGQADALNCIPLRASLCLCETKHTSHGRHGELAAIEMSAQEGVLLNSPSSRTISHPRYPPSPLSLRLHPRWLRLSAAIHYTVCTFDQRPRIMVFRSSKVGRLCARSENGKQTWVHHPLFPLSSKVS